MCSFEVENMQFGQYSKNYNCIPLPIILESKTKKELEDKIKSLKNKLYLITCKTLGNPTIAKMMKKCMLKRADFRIVLITMNPCCMHVFCFKSLELHEQQDSAIMYLNSTSDRFRTVGIKLSSRQEVRFRPFFSKMK